MSSGVQRLGQGRDRALQYLKENPIIHDEIEKVWMHNLLILLVESHSLFFNFISSNKSSVLMPSWQWPVQLVWCVPFYLRMSLYDYDLTHFTQLNKALFQLDYVENGL